MARLALGIDSSTQSITATVADIDTRDTVREVSIDYLSESSLARHGINGDYILPPQGPGDARQPVAMYFDSLDLLLGRLADELSGGPWEIGDIRVVNVSGQQHGHVMLSGRAEELFAALKEEPPEGDRGLSSLLEGALSLPFARIWRTADTAGQASHVREQVGGSPDIICLTGSDAPLRFSAFGIRKTALDYPAEYGRTALIHQISSLIPAVLCGEARIPLDWGNACGTSLMDYRARQWSAPLLKAVAGDLPGGASGLMQKLPPLGSGLTIAGTIAHYFVKRHGFPAGCLVALGSGDNPQSKVLVRGSLLSLGSSFVIMVDTDGKTFDMRGYANAMYDAIDRPFAFGCRTNGALRWDGIRAMHGLGKKDYGPAEKALAETPPGNNGRLFLWQEEAESFPASPAFEPRRIGYSEPGLAADYAGIVESTLASVYLNSKHFTAPGDELYVTGGPASSPEVLRRVAAIWNRRVVPVVESGGASLGAAASGACAWLHERGETVDTDEFCASFLARAKPVFPHHTDIEAFHGQGGLLARYAKAEKEIAG